MSWSHKYLGVVGVVAGLTLSVNTASAQLPPASPEQEAAGARVASVVFAEPTIIAERGDTVTLAPSFFDADGNRVEGAMHLLFARGNQLRRVGSMLDQSGRFLANRPGTSTVIALVRVAEDGDSYRGIDGIKQVGTIRVTVRDYPASRIAIAEPAYAPYAGTSFKMHGTVWTDHDTEHSSATIEWRSENPSVATVTPSGVLSLNQPGTVTLVASTENGISEPLQLQVVANPVRTLDISPTMAAARAGDVVMFDVNALDGRGRAIDDVALSYSVFGLDSMGGQLFEDGSFVAENPGAYRVVVNMGDLASSAMVEVALRPNPWEINLVDHGAVAHVATSDLWVFEGNDGRDYAYTGTHAKGGGERLFVWDVTDPANLVMVDSVVVNARVVNDVKVSDDASWAIITREGASDRKNGIVVLDLADPAHPTIIAEFTDSLTSGIHNVWINGDVVYAVNDGTSAMHILDLSDPANPRHVRRWELRPGDTNKSLHDVWADGQYAYLSYWDDGLVILDVGAGTHGGTPADPQFVSSIAYGMGNTHAAWRAGKYVFLGDEIGTPDGMRGYVHVIDVEDIDNPTEVAKYEVPEAGAHNIWVEDGLLYIAYYQGGLRIVDITGELRGDLYRQGRELAFYRTSAGEGEAITPHQPMAWGPQPYKGNIFVSDMNSGLWVIKFAQPQVLTP